MQANGLQDARKRAGLSARALAERCATRGSEGLNRGRVTNLELSVGRPIGVEELLVLSEVLDVSPVELLVGQTGDDDLVSVAGEWRTVGDVRERLGRPQPGAKANPFMFGTLLEALIPIVPVESRADLVEVLQKVTA